MRYLVVDALGGRIRDCVGASRTDDALAHLEAGEALFALDTDSGGIINGDTMFVDAESCTLRLSLGQSPVAGFGLTLVGAV